jgi:molecular chaperone DnaJ
MAAQSRDYYEVLGVERNAAADVIKRAYRKQAMKYHPDVCKDADAADRIKEINTAYEVLSDESKKARYDRFGPEGVNQPEGFGGFGGDSPFVDIFETIFGQQMGGRGSRSTVVRGDDLRYDMELTLEEAVLGAEKSIKFQRMESCDACGGNGAKPGTDAAVCPQCQGEGQVKFIQETMIGRMTARQTCPRCKGNGRVIASPCVACSGAGRMRKSRDRSVKVPAGVDTGMKMPLRGEGDAGERGGPAGDLYLVFHVKDHELFERRDNDLYCEVNISFTNAALGAVIHVPIINGIEELRIPEGTQSGQTFTLRGKGAPDVNGRGKGDEHVIVNVAVPTRLTAEQRDLLKQFADSMGDKTPEHENRSLFSRLFGT